jgi:hypothetical protein
MLPGSHQIRADGMAVRVMLNPDRSSISSRLKSTIISASLGRVDRMLTHLQAGM